MRIVDRKTFLAMPENTLFSKYEPCVFGPLQIKGESWNDDFLVQQIADAVRCDSSDEFAALCDATERGTHAHVDLDCLGRDGMFDQDQLFAVWERDDVLVLIERLKLCVREDAKEPA